jgi:two-component system response regulator HupR/HoxA
VVCAIIKSEDSLSPEQFEFLFASVEALVRLAEERLDNVNTNEQRKNLHSNLYRKTHPGGAFREIITIDPLMINVIRMVERVSKVDVPVLFEGETGVGKELFARAIHNTSPRTNREFVAINAGGVNVNLLESQLFGHVKGAFTDAFMNRVGLIEEAAGGSIFFDEIGEMSEELQVKLLRLLENNEFRRLGDNKLRHANVRVISATNRNLKEQVERGLFRKDLFYRLSTVRFSIPPLCFRQGDIELLVRKFLNDALVEIGRGGCHIEMDIKALEAFELYNWPGNVRELQNEILRVVSLIGNDETIRFNMLSDTIKNYFSNHKHAGLLEKNVERYERRLILRAHEKNDWNRIRTASQIGIPRTTLLGKMKRLNIVQ